MDKQTWPTATEWKNVFPNISSEDLRGLTGDSGSAGGVRRKGKKGGRNRETNETRVPDGVKVLDRRQWFDIKLASEIAHMRKDTR